MKVSLFSRWQRVNVYEFLKIDDIIYIHKIIYIILRYDKTYIYIY